MNLLRLSAVASVALAALSFAPPVSAKCVVRTITRADGGQDSVRALVPDRGQKDLEDAGYKDADCGGLDKAAYREKVCNPKSIGNSGVQRQLEIQSGISFVQLCTAARAEAGLPDTTSIQASGKLSSDKSRTAVPPRGPSLLMTTSIPQKEGN